MAQYIDKDCILAEIERIKKSIGSDRFLSEFEKGFNLGKEDACDDLHNFLNTLEVKEVNLEEEIDKWWCSLFTDYSMKRVPNHKFIPEPSHVDSNFKQSETGKAKLAFILELDWKVDSNDIEWDADTVREFAKHFYELGLKTKKGE